MRERINCHHNYRPSSTTRAGTVGHPQGRDPLGVGDLGVIPGSMGTSTYIVEGFGNEASYASCSYRPA
ncbi:MAG: RtcB family protein [Acidimicrobiales bacterium]